MKSQSESVAMKVGSLTGRPGQKQRNKHRNVLFSSSALVMLSAMGVATLAPVARADTISTTSSTTESETMSSDASSLSTAIQDYVNGSGAESSVTSAISSYQDDVSSNASETLSGNDTITAYTEISGSAIIDTTASNTQSGIENDQAHVSTNSDGDYWKVVGGAVYVDSGASYYVTGSDDATTTFSGNSAVATGNSYDAKGGYLYNDDGTVVIDNTTLASNSATSALGDAYGGAIDNEDGTVILTGSTLSNNSVEADDTSSSDVAYARGGAINTSGGTLLVYDTTFSGNTANSVDTASSGAINANGTTYIADSEFTDNGATAEDDAYGGAIYNYADLTISGTTFTGNYATATDSGVAEGGAIYNKSTGTVSLTDSDFTDNTVSGTTARGGAIYNAGGTVNLTVSAGETSTFSGNTANGEASSIYMAGGDLNVDVEDGGTLDMRDPMSGSSATIEKTGSGIWALGGTNTFSGSTSFDVSNGTLYLYAEGEVSDATTDDDDATVAEGNIDLTGSSSSFTLGSDATLVASGSNSVTAGTITLDDGATIRGATADDRSGTLLEDDDAGVTSSLTLSGTVELEGTLTVEAEAAEDEFTLNASLTDADGHAGSVEKDGAGTVILTEGSSYTGGTDVEEGTLSTTADSAIGDGLLTVNGGTLELNDTAQTVTGITSTADNGTIDLGTGSLVVDVADSESYSYSGAISGSGSLTKSGDGTQILTGTDSSTGTVEVDAGTLEVSGNGAITSASGITVTGGTLDATDGGSITSSGDISVENGTLEATAGGSISASGTIYVDDDASDATLIVTGTGSSVSAGSIVAGQDDATGTVIVSDGGTLTVDDGAGTVTLAEDDGSTGTLVIGSEAGETATAAGTVEAASVAFGDGTGSIVFNHTSDDYDFSSDISGEGEIDAYAGTTTLTGDNSDFSGTTNLYGGTLAIEDAAALGSSTIAFSGGELDTEATMTLANAISVDETDGGSLNVADGTVLTLTGLMTGDGTLTKLGTGELDLAEDDSDFAGTIDVSEGTTDVTGSYEDAAFYVEDGANLSGSGTIGSATIYSGGTLDLSDSATTVLSVTGDVTFESGSTYAVALDDDGNSSLLDVDGSVTINGGTLALTFADGVYNTETTYTVITASDGVTGTFDEVTDNLAYLTTKVTAADAYDDNNVYVVLTKAYDFGDLVDTDNTIHVGDVIDKMDDGELYDDILSLQDGEEDTAFNELSGEIHASVRAMLNGDSSYLRNTALDQMAHAKDLDLGGKFLWSKNFGDYARLEGDGNSHTLKETTGGVFIGEDTALSASWRGGLMGGFSKSTATVDETKSKADVQSFHFGAYAAGTDGENNLRLGAGLSLHDIHTRRQVSVSTLSDNLSADYFGYSSQVFAEVSHDFDTSIVKVSPFASLAFVHGHDNNYSENGDVAALTGYAQDMDTVIGDLGLRLFHPIQMGHLKGSLQGALSWTHLGGDRSARAYEAFSGSDQFSVTGVTLDQNMGTVSAGISFKLDDGAEVATTYSGSFGKSTVNQVLKATLSWQF